MRCAASSGTPTPLRPAPPARSSTWTTTTSTVATKWCWWAESRGRSSCGACHERSGTRQADRLIR
ncbi:hypothetical protein ACFPRL_06655 [Pseudoclavibacter helvolus]